MSIRDARTLHAVLEMPFEGYSRQETAAIAPDFGRIVALIAVLGTMVVSGILLGRERS